MKKVLVLVLTVILSVTMMSIPCFAIYDADIMPIWDNIASIEVTISFNQSQGTARGIVIGNMGSYSEGTLTIYEKVNDVWICVAEKTSTTTSLYFVVNVNFNYEAGNEYKAVFEGTVYVDGVGENFSSTNTKIA